MHVFFVHFYNNYLYSFFCIPTKLINHCGLKLWVHKTNIFFILIYSYSKKWNRQSTVSLCAKLLIFHTVQQAKSFSFEMNPTVTRWGKLLSSKTALSLFCARKQRWPYLDLTLYNLEMVLLLKFESKLVKRGWIKERKAHCYWVQQISI